MIYPPHPDATSVSHLLDPDCRRILRDRYQSIQVHGLRGDHSEARAAVEEYAYVVRQWIDDPDMLSALGVMA